jgi:tetratricopeptide (TPR) repeat protein
MKEAKPTFGHFVLAQILTKVAESCVITTNFDSLVESSIYQYTDKTPLVCGHESLSGYAKPSKIHPLIIKIHRDLLLAPKSDKEEIKKLDEGWQQPLNSIFNNHIPIVIGYGGNDGSLMTYFETMNKPSNFFWCLLKGSKPSKRIEDLIIKMDGRFVEIDGFDEMMHQLLIVFSDIQPPKVELETITKYRVQAITKQIEELENQPNNAADTKHITTKKELSAFEYDIKARAEPDYEKRKAIYVEALDKYPNTAWLWNNFTYFLQWVKKDFSNLEENYQKALAIDPENATINGSYAIYLDDFKKDYATAEKYYLKALALEPEHANFYGSYASFLSGIKNDYDNAEKYFLKALDINPDDADFNGNYANFLSGIKNDYDNAEKYYLKAISIDPEHAINNGNYAQFLLVRNRKNEATVFLDKAFESNNNEQIELVIELWFYRYAHYPEWLAEAEKNMEDLLQKGIQSIDWNLEENVETAILNGHPYPEKLKEFAERITKSSITNKN